MTQSLAYFHVRYKVMEPFKHCCVSLEIYNGKIKCLDASDVNLLALYTLIYLSLVHFFIIIIHRCVLLSHYSLCMAFREWW